MVAVLLARGPAEAQDATAPDKVAKDLSELSFEQLVDLSIDSVYSASAYAQKITEAPASVSIVTSDDIDAFGYRTLADVLRSVRGFYVTNDRNYSYLGVRGFSRPGDYNARILLLVDGHRMNDNVFGSALLGTEFALGPRHHRAHRDRPRSELVALRHERVLRGHQRHHQEGRDHRRLRRRREPRQLRHQPRPRQLRQGVRQRRADAALGFRLRE